MSRGHRYVLPVTADGIMPRETERLRRWRGAGGHVSVLLGLFVLQQLHECVHIFRCCVMVV